MTSIIFAYIISILCFYFGYIRNDKVLLFRKEYCKNCKTIEELKKIDDISFYEMVFKFWKPLTKESWGL